MMSLIDSIDGHVLERCFAWLDIGSLGRAGATCAGARAIAARGALWEPHCCALSALDPETLRALGAPGDGGWFGRAAEVASVLAAQERFYEARAARGTFRFRGVLTRARPARARAPPLPPREGLRGARPRAHGGVLAAERGRALRAPRLPAEPRVRGGDGVVGRDLPGAAAIGADGAPREG